MLHDSLILKIFYIAYIQKLTPNFFNTIFMEKKGIVAHLDSVNEYEREPIPKSKLKGLKSFIGMYAGEHTAGTEFVIGPLFVAHGVTAFDLTVGLLVGNLLAVLS